MESSTKKRDDIISLACLVLAILAVTTFGLLPSVKDRREGVQACSNECRRHNMSAHPIGDDCYCTSGPSDDLIFVGKMKDFR